MTDKPSIFGLRREDLAAEMKGLGEKAYRADQIFTWLYKRFVFSPSEMTNLSKSLRDTLEAAYSFELPEVGESLAADDQTVKHRIVFADGKSAECVVMPEMNNFEERKPVSLCISTQIGCALKCAFCATGTMGLARNLSTAEIVSQVVKSLSLLGFEPTTVNILFMGMGEPLLNLEATIAALEIFNDSHGLDIPMRRITVSTSGIPKGIVRLFEMQKPPRLALSLHAPTQELRQTIMPIATKYDLGELMDVCRALPLAAREKITMEYILLAGINDSPQHAKQLTRLLHGIPAKINLIPFNGWSGSPYAEPTEEQMNHFAGLLAASGLTATVRRSRGRSAAAACGQLAISKNR